MATRSTDEAMNVLNEQRAALIAAARQVAIDLINKEGFAHSRSVRTEMDRRGLLAGYDGKDFWLGAVFRDEMFEPAGRWFEYSDHSRNIHERRVHVWKLRVGAPRPAPLPPKPLWWPGNALASSLPAPAVQARPAVTTRRRARRAKVSANQLALFSEVR